MEALNVLYGHESQTQRNYLSSTVYPFFSDPVRVKAYQWKGPTFHENILEF